jgi:hypothetical protein
MVARLDLGIRVSGGGRGDFGAVGERFLCVGPNVGAKFFAPRGPAHLTT